MIKVNFVGLEGLKRKSRHLSSSYRQGINDFFRRHLGREVRVSGLVIRNINRMIYQTEDPDWYERTGALLESVKIEETDRSYLLYMDGEYLERKSAESDFTKHEGFDAWVKGVNYAWLVERGHTFMNITDRGSTPVQIPYTMDSRPFMDNAWFEMLTSIRPEVILEPLFRMWSS